MSDLIFDFAPDPKNTSGVLGLRTHANELFKITDRLQEIRQRIEVRLRVHLGEWAYESSLGVPYLDFLQDVYQDLPSMKVVFRNQIMQVDGVISIEALELTIDDTILGVKARIKTDKGVIDVLIDETSSLIRTDPSNTLVETDVPIVGTTTDIGTGLDLIVPTLPCPEPMDKPLVITREVLRAVYQARHVKGAIKVFYISPIRITKAPNALHDSTMKAAQQVFYISPIRITKAPNASQDSTMKAAQQVFYIPTPIQITKHTE